MSTAVPSVSRGILSSPGLNRRAPRAGAEPGFTALAG